MPHAPRRPQHHRPEFLAHPVRPRHLSENRSGGGPEVSRGLSAFGGVVRRGSALPVFVPAATAIYAALFLKSKNPPRAGSRNPQVSADRGRIGLSRVERTSNEIKRRSTGATPARRSAAPAASPA